MRFAQTLSNFYQGIDLPRPAYYTPRPFSRPPIPPANLASLATVADFDLLHKDEFLRLEDAYAAYADDHARSTPVRIRITVPQCLKLKALIEEQMKTDSNPLSAKENISRQDAISAYLVMTLNRYLPRPIARIQNLWNVCSIPASMDPIAELSMFV